MNLFLLFVVILVKLYAWLSLGTDLGFKARGGPKYKGKKIVWNFYYIINVFLSLLLTHGPKHTITYPLPALWIFLSIQNSHYHATDNIKNTLKTSIFQKTTFAMENYYLPITKKKKKDKINQQYPNFLNPKWT